MTPDDRWKANRNCERWRMGMKVLLDTSILVAAARSRTGASYALISRLPDPRFKTVISVPLFLEYRSVLLRPENSIGRTVPQVDGFLGYLLSISDLQEIFYLWRPALADPADDFILELAVAANCRYIITHNLPDFRDTERWGVKAVSPSSFLKFIDSKL